MIKILYEDRVAAVAEKPASLLSEPAPGGEDIVTALSQQLGVQCYLVHRPAFFTGLTGEPEALCSLQSQAPPPRIFQGLFRSETALRKSTSR
mgnify:CR=1 FL=1